MGPVLGMWVVLHNCAVPSALRVCHTSAQHWRLACASPIPFRVLDRDIVRNVMCIGLPDCTVSCPQFMNCDLGWGRSVRAAYFVTNRPFFLGEGSYLLEGFPWLVVGCPRVSVG